MKDVVLVVSTQYTIYTTPSCLTGNELPGPMGLQPWLKSQGVGKTRVSSLASVPHDLYAIGTQEAKVSEKDWVNRVKRLLHNQFNIDFHLVSGAASIVL